MAHHLPYKSINIQVDIEILGNRAVVSSDAYNKHPSVHVILSTSCATVMARWTRSQPATMMELVAWHCTLSRKEASHTI
jgi:hypothetical protein